MINILILEWVLKWARLKELPSSPVRMHTPQDGNCWRRMLRCCSEHIRKIETKENGWRKHPYLTRHSKEAYWITYHRIVYEPACHCERTQSEPGEWEDNLSLWGQRSSLFLEAPGADEQKKAMSVVDWFDLKSHCDSGYTSSAIVCILLSSVRASNLPVTLSREIPR